ncbi:MULTISPECIES: DUF2171 domain-containing protein [Deinococcus]|uniref:DUF2171 domain-containing protein n=3 Tax=Deinococcus TaxID=1298 RepID=F0RQJ0_DEIPM|nr:MULTISPECIES: DUF2171 domain-containing protein [Deinococcus]ADY27549.1 Protein of unknown function DUF2171 [Deinococcus proteolyticus MRP]MCY1704360.1 DUF2171 domain-containing protein [Deinococcus sp. SL84]UFA52013.1 DUF2171 domain-containing protein [Deinococcus radiophilus]GHG12413.1 hypothetical protein GCM10017783_25650 [Deinococcus piscis]
MTMGDQIKADMPILCADGNEHGKVDHLDGEYIKITKDAHGQHHWLPLSTVDHVDQHVHLKLKHEEVKQQMLSEDPHPEHRK